MEKAEASLVETNLHHQFMVQICLTFEQHISGHQGKVLQIALSITHDFNWSR